VSTKLLVGLMGVMAIVWLVAPSAPGHAVAQEDAPVSHAELASELDTDGDGVSDTYEVTYYGTDPNYWDTDFDNLTDGQEILDYRTDPRSADSDGDGVSDGAEVFQGSDPLVGFPIEPGGGGGGGSGGGGPELPEFDLEGAQCLLDPDSCFQEPRVLEAEETDQ
jgi:hypothetical protein